MFTRTVEPKTLATIKDIMLLPSLKNHVLVGGTALALQLGHRVSVDIDLFGHRKYKNDDLKKELESIGTLDIVYLDSANSINSAYINEIKLDIVDYPYDWIDDLVIDENVRMASTKDISAMKISAIGGRGAKKDFYDLYFLLEIYDIHQMLVFFKEKYGLRDVLHYIYGLSHFVEADRDLDPTTFSKLSWQKVKDRIIKAVQQIDFSRL